MDATDIVVFLGPSLPPGEARRTLPARYLPPARCGDVLRIRRLKPRAIALIDGLFETTAAVWHKEILLALEDGIAVLGASSMGALRAAELEPYGMTGVGAIFEAFRDGVYTDDDDVALLHGSASAGYPAYSEPMVNIRATVTAAVDMRVIDRASGDHLLRCAKSIFYQERSLAAAMAMAWGSATHLDDAVRFRRFLEQGGYVDQKRLDALALLEHLASLGDRFLRSDRVAEPTPRTCFIRRLQYDVTCDPLDVAEGDLPQDERVASEARSLGAVYPLLQRLARLMAMAHALASNRGLVATPEDVGRVYERYEFGVGPAALTKRWSQARDLSDAALASFVERLALIGALLADASRQLSPSKRRERYESALLALLRIDGRYEQWRPRRSSRSSPSRAVVRHAARQADAIGGLYRRTATVWSALDGVLDELGLMPYGQMQAQSDAFRRRRGLEGRDATLAWQRANDLRHSAYEAVVAFERRLAAMCEGHMAYWIGLPHELEPVSWLLDAIRLVGLYGTLKRRVVHRSRADRRQVQRAHR